MAVDLSIIIPCYNEIDNVTKLKEELFPVVRQILQNDLLREPVIQKVEVIFVDDGSSDGTGQALRHLIEDETTTAVSVQLLSHEVNQGLGQAMRTGFEAAIGDIVVTTDCDGTYRFSEIPRLLSNLTSQVDLVTASPYHPEGAVDGVPGYRLVLSKGASTIYRLLTDRRVHTYTALFRAYRKEVIKTVPFNSNDFLAGSELLVNAMRMGFKVAEYPTVLHKREFGESKAKLALTVKAHLGFQLQSLLPWHPYGTVIRGSNKTVYLFENGLKRLFPNGDIFESHGFHWQQIVQFPDKFINRIPTGPPLTFRDGTLLKGSGQTVYVIEHGKKRAIVSETVFAGLGYQWQQVVNVADAVLQQVVGGEEVATKSIHPDGSLLKTQLLETVFLLEDGQKRPFLSEKVFLSWNYKWHQVIMVDEKALAQYTNGPAVEPQKPFDQNLFGHSDGDMQSHLVTELPVEESYLPDLEWR